MSDFILETIRAIIVVIILLYLWLTGARENINKHKGWFFIISGFFLITFGMLIDITDEFPHLDKYVIIGDTEVQAFLEKVVGYLIGFLLLSIGFWRWMPHVIALSEVQRELKEENKERKQAEAELLEQRNHLDDIVSQRTSELKNANKQLLTEIKERVKIEEQLNQAQKMDAIGRLAGGVAHDFNNILSAINGYAELCLMKMGEDNPFREEINIILESGQRAARLTQQLLAFSRKQIIRQEFLDVNNEIEVTRKMLGRLLGEDIEIEIIQDPELWPIKADRSQLEQIVLNLAINARDSMPLGGKLTIETANVSLDEAYVKEHYNITPGDYIMLTISDTGQGMTQEIKEHIFEPFFTTKEKGKGTGLGLATVYGIVKQNNGEIMVYSESGKGTTFKIYLPSPKETAAEKEASPIEEDKSVNRGTETIMLVEDDEMVRKMSVDIFTELGYIVLEGENGNDALQIYSRYHGTIDLLLTDVVMPKMSGVELAEKMTELCPKIKVLFMSGYTENAIVKHGVLADGVNFIHKPVTPQSLSQAVRKILD